MGGRASRRTARRAALIVVAVVVTTVTGSPAAMAAGEGSDLIVSALSDPPESAVPGGTFQATDTTQNIGSGDTVESETVFLLALPPNYEEPYYVLGVRTVGVLSAGGTSTVQTEMTIPIDTPPGGYHFAACADNQNANNESNVDEPPEQNNCFLNDDVLVEVAPANAPDLKVTQVGEPPAKRYRGQTMAVTDTTKNTGEGKAPVSATRYVLSENLFLGDLDDVVLPQNRLVPKLAIGASNQGGTTVSIPHSTPLGSYRLFACADGPDQIDEGDESNNCKVSTNEVTIFAARPDLVVKAVSNPPDEKPRGAKFSVTDTTKNIGTTSAPGSQTWYRLSKDKQAGNDKPLDGARSVPGLPMDGQHQGGKQVTIPGSTAPGLYYVLACADGGTVVPEINEKNNCKASQAQIQVRGG